MLEVFQEFAHFLGTTSVYRHQKKFLQVQITLLNHIKVTLNVMTVLKVLKKILFQLLMH